MPIDEVKFLDLKRENNQYEPALTDAALRVVQSGYYILGPEVEAFEEEWAAYCGTNYSVGVSNGLDALELVLLAWGIGPEDEVIVPSNTYIATWLAVDAVGARVVPVEPNPLSYLIEATETERAITPKTKAIIGVHLYGRSLDGHSLRNMCDDHGIKFLEDGAQAHGAMESGVRVGAQGHAAAFSFYPGKNLGALGDAGAVTTDDYEVYTKIKELRNYGSAVKYVNKIRGKNCRLDPIQAATLSVKLKGLDAANERRKEIAQMYLSKLSACKGVSLPIASNDAGQNVWHVFPVRVKEREKIQNALKEKGVDTLIHYPIPPHKQNAYSDYYFESDSFPIANQIHEEILSLPISSTHSDAEIDHVINCLTEVV